MKKVYYSNEVANDFKNTTGMLKRDFKVLTVTSTSYGYTAEILEKIQLKKIVFNKVNNNFVQGKDIKKYL